MRSRKSRRIVLNGAAHPRNRNDPIFTFLVVMRRYVSGWGTRPKSENLKSYPPSSHPVRRLPSTGHLQPHGADSVR
uniref:Uncharacterized protein n=1 Tax=Rhizophora mucronata TaxID=61149 RepID=A0A2P2JIF1_RHIMU